MSNLHNLIYENVESLVEILKYFRKVGLPLLPFPPKKEKKHCLHFSRGKRNKESIFKMPPRYLHTYVTMYIT
jgi:hypothetical protein